MLAPASNQAVIQPLAHLSLLWWDRGRKQGRIRVRKFMGLNKDRDMTCQALSSTKQT